MASPISTTDGDAGWTGRVIRHDAFADALAMRREALGQPDMPRNAGNRRTDSKRALLEALTEAGGDW